MPFSFLNPWFWLGAFALAGPVWLHLRRKRQTELLRFSAVRFLPDHSQPPRSPHRLRDPLLLALRALALCLVLAAFAWPYLRSFKSVLVRESRVYVLDNTLSHQANNGFARACAQLQRELKSAGADVQVAVVELTGSPRVVARFSEPRPSALLAVSQLQPSFERGSYLGAFRLANSLLSESLGSRKRIIFLGDNQENQWTESTHTPAFLHQVEVELPRPAVASLPNLSLSQATVQRLFLGDRALLNFSVQLRHSGDCPRATVAIRANDQTVFSRVVPLEKQPETLLIQAEWEAPPGVWLQGSATVTGQPDSLPADNTVFFSVPPVLESKVALLAQSPYLRLALSPEIMRGHWSTRVLEPEDLASELARNQDADVLCLESSRLESPDARKLLHRYLEHGRGVLLLVNRLTPVIDACLLELGFHADGVVRAPPDEPESFQFISSNHPIFHPFLSPDFGNLADIRLMSYARLRSDQAAPLLFSHRGDGLFFQGTKSAGKLLVAAFGMDRDQTSWPVHPTFIPFLDLALQAARAPDPSPNSFEPGEMAVLPFADAGLREISLRAGETELARAPVEQGRAQLRMPERPGIYVVAIAPGGETNKLICVNPSPKESLLSFVASPAALRDWEAPPGHGRREFARWSEDGGGIGSGVLQQQWWWWMVVTGVGALILETGWAGVRKEWA